MEQVEAWASEAPQGKARAWAVQGDSVSTGYSVSLEQYVPGTGTGWSDVEVQCTGYGETQDAAFADAKVEFDAQMEERQREVI